MTTKCSILMSFLTLFHVLSMLSIYAFHTFHIMVSSFQHNWNALQWGLYLELRGIYMPWSYDIADITCPTFVYHGPKDEVPVEWAEFSCKTIGTNAKLVVMKEHGHCSISKEFSSFVVPLSVTFSRV